VSKLTQVYRRFAWAAALPVVLAALLWPALWNGFPIVYYDTGGYLARPFEGTLGNGRSALYGAFLALGIPLDFWPNVIAQAALVAWLVVLTLRVNGLGGRPALATVVVIGLCVLTGLPWYAAQLLPDILVPVAVLSLHLLAFQDEAIRPWERLILAAALAFAIASHMTILALALGLMVALALWRAFTPWLNLPRPTFRVAALPVALGLLLALLSNFLIAGRFVFTPGGTNFVFGRLVQDGIVSRYLADHCPDPAIRLCPFHDDIAKRSANGWLWDQDSPLYRLGGFETFAPEAQRIAVATLIAYPGLHARMAAKAALDQFVSFATGDEIVSWTWHTHSALEQFAPQTYPAFRAARQQQAPIDFSIMNTIHVPAAWLAIAGLPLILLAATRRRVPLRAAALAVTVLLALVGNAIICGALSNPHDRYQSRLVPLAPLAVAIAALSYRRRGARVPDV